MRTRPARPVARTTVTRTTVARTTTALAAAVGLALAAPGAAQAKDKLPLDVTGYAPPTAPSDGVYAFSGSTTALDDTFYGTTFSGTFGPTDRTLPQDRACEAAAGSLTIASTTGSVTLAVQGELCEHWGTYPTTGSWSVSSATGSFARAKGSGMFFWNAQSWGTLWAANGTFKS